MAKGVDMGRSSKWTQCGPIAQAVNAIAGLAVVALALTGGKMAAPTGGRKMAAATGGDKMAATGGTKMAGPGDADKMAPPSNVTQLSRPAVETAAAHTEQRALSALQQASGAGGAAGAATLRWRVRAQDNQ